MIRSFRSRNRTRTKGRIIAIIDDGGEEEVPVIPTIAVTWSSGFEDGVVPADTLVDTIVAQVDVTPSNSVWFLSAENNIVYRDGVVLRLARAVTFPDDGTFQLDLEVTGTTDVLLTEFMVVADATPTAFRYIMPVAAGLGNGTSWANAAPLTGLNGQIASTLADGEIWIRGDAGTYTLSGSIPITSGSTDGHAKQIRGVDVDGNDHLTDIINNRTDWTLPADPETVTSTTGWTVGLDVMRLQTGANNLTFQFIGFRRVSYGFYIRNAIRNLTIEDCEGYNVRRFYESEATVTGLIIRRPTVVGFSKQCIRLDGATNDVLIEDFDLNSGRQADDAFAQGIICDNGSTCHDILIRNGVISNCHYSSNASDVTYQNADGISTEGGNYDVTIQDVEIYGCTDGGVDLKGGTPDGPIVLTRVNCHNNKRNFRLWCWGTVDDCVSTDPELRGNEAQSGNVPTHLGLYSGAADVLVAGFTMTDSFTGTQRFAVEASAAVLRLDDVTDNSLSILDYIEIGGFDPLIYNPTDAGDTVAVTWTADTTASLDEGLTLNHPLTYTSAGDPDVKFVLVGASDGMTLSAADTRDGTVNLQIGIQDYESLDSPDLVAVIDAYNSKRVKARTTITVTIDDVAGDTGGSVTTSTSHGWRWDQPTVPTNVTLSGSENKTATYTSGGTNATVRGTAGMFPPLHYKTYFEFVPGVIGSAANFAVGLMNLSELQTVPLGTTNHSFGYFADGSVKLNGVTVATFATYAATNVIGFATTLNNWDWEDVRDNPSHIHDWKDRSVSIYKNGVIQGTIDISEIVDALYPAVALFTTNDAAAVRSTSTEWTQFSATGGTGYPGSAETGYEGSLVASGDITTSANGQTISGKLVTGKIQINHNNVTVEDCKVIQTSFFGIQVAEGKTGVIIQDTEVDGNEQYTGILTDGTGTIIRRCDIHTCENAIVPRANDVIVADNYIHDLSSSGNPDPHFDGLEVLGGISGLQVTGNTILMPNETAAVNLSAFSGNISSVLIDGNYLAYGSNTIICDDQFDSRYNLTSITISNNQILPTSPGTEYLFRGGQANVGVTLSGNTILTTPLTTGGGAYSAWGTVSKLSVTGTGAARYVTPTGTGTGLSWATAAPISSAPALIRSLGASGGTNPHLFVRADLGMYSRSSNVITLTGGGSAVDNPVVVTGVDVNLIPIPYHTFGARTAWFLPNDPTQETANTSGYSGAELFALSTGAKNITFRQFHVRRALCNVRLRADCDGIIVEDATFYNNRRGLFESDANKTADGIILRRFQGTGFSKSGVTIKGTTDDALVENFYLNGGRQWGDAGYAGIKWDDTAHDGTVRLGYCMQLFGDTGNLGDGHESNNGNDNIHLEDCVVYQARDGGIDYKADGATIDRCLVYESTRNYKIWSDQLVATDNFSYNPVASAYQSIFHQGQDAPSDVTWVRHRMYNPGSIYLQNWNQCSRFIDGQRINEASAFAVNALPTGVTQTFDSSNGSSRILFGLSTDVTGPTITSASTKNLAHGNTLAHTLTASENVTWSIVGGSYLAQNPGAFYDGNFDLSRPNGQTPALRLLNNALAAYDEDTPANNIKAVTVRATDSVGNTTTQVITVTITPAVTVPNWTAIWTFEGTNNSTTLPVDTVGGKVITSVGGAKLTTTSPLSGSSSLFCDGVDDRAASPDHEDWWFDAQFVIEALFRANSLATNGMILSQYQTATGLRSWLLNVTTAGELNFTWSFDGTTTAALTTSGLGLVTGTNYLVRVDRDSLGVIRIYAATAASTSIPMVAKRTGVTGAFRNSTVNLVVGGSATSGGGTVFNGVIDKVRIEKGNAPEASDSGFTITASGDETLWPSSTPLTVVDMASGVTAGTVFHITEGSSLKGVRFYRGNASVASTFEAAINTTGVLPTAYTAAVYSTTGTPLATKSVTGQTTVGGWITITFDTPVALSVGVDYTACVFQAAVSGSVYYPAQAGVFDSSATVVSASTAIVGTSGLIGFGASLAKPSNAVGNTAYFIDPVVTF